jgi:tungstate transport system substrate-binding protein
MFCGVTPKQQIESVQRCTASRSPDVKKELGQRFIDYLISPDGQKAIGNYKIGGKALFYPNANDPGA